MASFPVPDERQGLCTKIGRSKTLALVFGSTPRSCLGRPLERRREIRNPSLSLLVVHSLSPVLLYK
jgi:hypothetical protein